MFDNKELEKMSKEQLIMYIAELQNKLAEFDNMRKPISGVVLTGAKPYVRKYIDQIKALTKKGGDE